MKIKNYFNKNYLKLYLIDVIYFILTFGFVFFALYKINQYTTILKTINSEQVLMQDYKSLAATLNIAGPLANKILLLFFLIPIISFVLYTIFQGFSWSRLTGIKYKNYIWRFLLITIIYGLIIYVLAYLLSIWSIGIVLDILFLIVIYILFVNYAATKKDFIKDCKKSFILSFRKFYHLFLIYILWIIFSLIVLFFYTIAKGFLSITISIIALLILIALFTLFKRIFCNFVIKHI